MMGTLVFCRIKTDPEETENVPFLFHESSYSQCSWTTDSWVLVCYASRSGSRWMVFSLRGDLFYSQQWIKNKKSDHWNTHQGGGESHDAAEAAAVVGAAHGAQRLQQKWGLMSRLLSNFTVLNLSSNDTDSCYISPPSCDPNSHHSQPLAAAQPLYSPTTWRLNMTINDT